MRANEFITEKSKSKSQSKLMTAACKNAEFRKKVDIPKDVACDFHKADKGEFHEDKETLENTFVGKTVYHGTMGGNEDYIEDEGLKVMAPEWMDKWDDKPKPAHGPSDSAKSVAGIYVSLDLDMAQAFAVEKSGDGVVYAFTIQPTDKILGVNEYMSSEIRLGTDVDPSRLKLVWNSETDPEPGYEDNEDEEEYNEYMASLDEDKETLNPPSIDVGDEVKTGKFKNSKATVKGFKKDDHNQPVLKTNKGDKKLFNLRLSKLQETYEYARRDEEFFSHEDYDAAQAELQAMGGGMFPSKAVREKYKPFGKLGKLTKPEQVMQHQLAGVPKHEWSFHAQYSGFSEVECRICGRKQKLSAKGRPISR